VGAHQRHIPVGAAGRGVAQHLIGRHRVQLVEPVEDHDLDSHGARVLVIVRS